MLSTTIILLISIIALSNALMISKIMSSRKTSLFMADKIAVFGGTGQTGSECVYQALKSGSKVVVLARTPSKMMIPSGSGGSSAGKRLVDPGLEVIQGDVVDPNDVNKIFASGDITGVIIALGGKTKEVGKTMLTDGTTNVINSMKKYGIKRIAVVTSIGTGDSENQAPFFFKVLMMTAMKNTFKDKNNQEKLFTSSDGIGKDLDYCIVRPGGLGIGAPTGVINVIDGESGSIQRADVAAFCLGAVLDKNFPYIRKTPCISSIGGTGWVKEAKPGFDAAGTV